MANNRLYIVCKKCNDFVAVTKYYPSSGWGIDTDMDKWVNPFIEKHEEHAMEIDINGGEYFAFVTEIDDRVKIYDFVNNKIYLWGDKIPEGSSGGD